jgi:hypothetical protein
MKSEHEVWKSAKHLVEQHGDEATAFAEARAQGHLDKGDDDNWALWMRIAAATLEIRNRPGRAPAT